MKIVKKSISLPEDIYKFAVRMARKQARERGGHENVSSYIRELVANDKNRNEQTMVVQA